MSTPPPNHRPLDAVLLLFAPLLPLMLSAAVRGALRVPLWVGLVLSLLAVAAGLGLARRSVAWPTPGQWVALALGLAATGAAWWLLWNPDLGPLATVGGGDAGNHVSLQRDFVSTDPGAYQGFVVFHGTAHWFGRGAQGFAAAFYLVVGCVLLCAAAAAAALLPSGRSPRRTAAAWLVLGALLAAGVLRVWGPWLHYQQADGFYAQVFALVPLLLGWLAYGTARSLWARGAVVVVWAGLARYTYGLNLGDCLLAAAAVAAWESTAAKGRGHRALMLLGAAGLAGASVVAYRALAPLRLIEHGALVAADVRQLLIAQGLMVAFLGLSLWRLGGLRDAVTRLEQRLVLFPLLFGAISLAVQLLYLAARWPQRYYFLKYNFLPVIWLSVAAAALVPLWLTRGRAAAALALPAVGALALIAHATAPQWFTFRERAFRERPYEHVEALTDEALADQARRVLAARGARSGGVLEPSWPRGNFLNAALGSFHSFNEGRERFVAGALEQREGTCVFWLEGPQVAVDFEKVTREVGPAPVESWRRLLASVDKQCVPHERRWRPQARYQLCWRCGPSPPG